MQPLPFEKKLICFAAVLDTWTTFRYEITFFKNICLLDLFLLLCCSTLKPFERSNSFFLFFFDFVKIFLSTTAQNVFRAEPRRAVDTKVSDSHFVVIHLNSRKVASMRCVLKVQDFGTTGPGLHSDPRRVRDFSKKYHFKQDEREIGHFYSEAYCSAVKLKSFSDCSNVKKKVEMGVYHIESLNIIYFFINLWWV